QVTFLFSGRPSSTAHLFLSLPEPTLNGPVAVLFSRAIVDQRPIIESLLTAPARRCEPCDSPAFSGNARKQATSRQFAALCRETGRFRHGPLRAGRAPG